MESRSAQHSLENAVMERYLGLGLGERGRMVSVLQGGGGVGLCSPTRALK